MVLLRPFRLYLVTDRSLFPETEAMIRAIASVARSLEPGELGIEVREKDLSGRQQLDLAIAISQAVAGTGTRVLIADRADIAAAVSLDGVHLPANGIKPADCRRFFGGIIGLSTHSVDEVASAADADFVTFGPVFDTPSKRIYGPPLGLDRLRDAVSVSPVPVYAIGGIDRTTASAVMDSGVSGVAVIRGVLAAPDPAQAAVEIIHRAGLRDLP